MVIEENGLIALIKNFIKGCRGCDMTLAEIREWIKPQITDLQMCYCGRTDASKAKVICLYDEASSNNIISVGGVSNTSTAHKRIRILIQWSDSQSETETKAQEIYKLFEGTHAVINGVECFFNLQYDNPVSLGVNDNDIFEYVVDLTITYKRG